MLDERTIRLIETAAAFVGVPILVVLSYRRWLAQIRGGLPHWRNGIGLASLTLVSMSWLWFVLTLAEARPHSDIFALRVLDFMVALATLFAPFCALAWRRSARLYAIAATVVMMFGGRALIYA